MDLEWQRKEVEEGVRALVEARRREVSFDLELEEEEEEAEAALEESKLVENVSILGIGLGGFGVAVPVYGHCW